MHRALLALCLSLPAAALAGDKITPEKAAEIQHAKNKAETEVQKKYGNKKDSELSKEERKAKAKDLHDAALGVYEKQGVEDKDYERYKGSQPKDDRATEKAALDGLVKKDKEAAEAEKAKAAEKEKAAAAGENIPIQRGFSDKNPVELENFTGQPTVEHGLPDEATREMEEARGASGESGGPPPAAGGPSGKPAGKGKGKAR